MDHCGNIGMLRKDIPIVASPESMVIMKGMQDAGISSLETDTAYFSPRQPADDLGLYLGSVAGMSYHGKDFCCTEPPSEALGYPSILEARAKEGFVRIPSLSCI